jgi:hypothetical protein
MDAAAKKALPDPRKYPLIAPDMDYVYFDGAERFPFQADATEYSPANAWWLAEAAFLSYAHPGFARMAYKLAGFNGFQFFGGKTTECMVSWNTQVAVISFRGTELRSLSTLRELVTDLSTMPIDFPEGGRVHRGFCRALEEVWPGEKGCEQAIEKLSKGEPGRPIWFTGHSLGAALASLAFARVPSATGLYVFGSPRVGDEEFASLMKDRQVWRIENARDPIALVPPDAPRLGLNFTHIGNLVYIAEDGELESERPVFDLQEKLDEAKRTFAGQIERIRRFFRSRKTTGEASRLDDELTRAMDEWKEYLDGLDHAAGIRLEDHMPIMYAIRLWNLLADHPRA